MGGGNRGGGEGGGNRVGVGLMEKKKVEEWGGSDGKQ